MPSEIVKKTQLPSGLRVITESLPDRESVSLGIWIEVGSRHEDLKVAGVSHFLEHMVFKGTPTRSAKQIATELERLGGVLNAFTTREHTCYHARILCDDLPVAVDLLADIATRATIPGAEVVKERKVIAEEIKDTQDTPHEHIHDVFAEQMWPDHPIGRPIAGSLESVRRTTRERLTQHRRLFYRPDRIVVAASGALSHNRLLALVKRHLDLPAPSVAPPLTPAVNGTQPRRAVISREINQTHVLIGFPTWPFVDKRRYAALVTTNLMGGGMSSRLFQSVREKRGLVYSIYAFQDSFVDTGFFAVYFACDPAQVVVAADLVLEELGKLRRQAIPAAELRDAQSQLKGNLALGLESTSSRMHRLARHELYLGGYVTPKQTMRSIDKVTVRDVAGVATEAFLPERAAASILGPVDQSVLDRIDWGRLDKKPRRAPVRPRAAA
ncbi:MAG TPA: pitrilysin family protein [bacterium]|nr:pitrilysin family protein [bacterium]